MASSSPSAPLPRLFYHPAYWCHSCDMSIGLPPSPTPNALLCPHCHRDSLEQMEMEMELDDEDSDSPPPSAPRNAFSLDNNSPSAPAFTPSDDNFLLNSPYLHRLIHHLTTTSAVSNPSSDPAPKASIESLEEVTITSESDPTMLCPVCKDPFVENSVAKMMPCKHTYHSDCIIPWLEINNSCPVCRYKLPPVPQEQGKVENEEYVGNVRLEELVDDEEVDLFGFRNTLRHIARRHRWIDDENIGNGGSGSEGNLFSPTQIGEVGRGGGGGGGVILERENSVETVSSWPRWQVVEERGGGGGGVSGGNDADDAFARS